MGWKGSLHLVSKSNIGTYDVVHTFRWSAECWETSTFGMEQGVRQEATSSAQSQCLKETIQMHRIFPSETAF